MNNYNLMRLANLYGGMNKYAAGDPAGVGDRHIAVTTAVRRAVANGEMTPEQAEKVLNSYSKVSMAENAAATPVTGSQAASDMVAAGASGAKLPVVGSDAAGNTIVLKPGEEPGMLAGLGKWVKENPLIAGGIGAGALGLGGLGAYYALKDDEEEEEGRKKTAGYIDPYVAQVLAHDYITKMASANGLPTVAAGVTGLSNYLNIR